MKRSTGSVARLLLPLVIVAVFVQPVHAANAAAGPGGLLPWQIAGLGELGRVVRVVDAQTLEVKVAGLARVVRLAGVAAPAAGACGHAQAVALSDGLVRDRLVVLEPDSAGSGKMYVYRVDGPMVSEELVRAGWARPDDAQSRSQHYFELVGAARAARQAGSGGWSACGWGRAVVPAAQAAVPPQPAARDAAIGQATSAICTALSKTALEARIDKLPEQAYLRDGDCITIYGGSDWTGPAWSGRYIYHPAGSTLKLGVMYVRWRDGFVAITANRDGTYDAHFMANNVGQVVMFGMVIYEGRDATTVATLVRDAYAADVIRIPNNAWLFRDAGKGMVTTLVDSFEFVSGDMRY